MAVTEVVTSPRAPARMHRGTRAFRNMNMAMFAAGLATFGLIYCVQPLMPAFSAEYGVNEATSALSLSVTTVLLAFGMLLAGAVADRFGRKPVMVASIMSSAVLVLVSAVTPGWHSFLLTRTLLGITVSGLPAVAMTYLAEEVDAESIGLGMGLYISGSAVGGMGGRLIAGVVADVLGWRLGIVAVGVVCTLAGLMFWRALPASRHFTPQAVNLRSTVQHVTGMFHDSGLPWLFLEGFLLLGAFVTVYNYLGYRLMAAPYHLSQAAVGLLFSIYIVGMFSSTWMGDLAGRLGRRRVFWTAFVIMLAGLALTLVDSLWVILLGVALVTFGFFGGHSIASSWVGRRATQRGAGTHGSSSYLFAYYMGSSLCGFSGGLFYANDGWNGVAIFVGALVLAGLLVALRLHHLPPLRGAASMRDSRSSARRAAAAQAPESVGTTHPA
ncbi:MAG TPA: MFS transporter [Nevskiaceae bacterium]